MALKWYKRGPYPYNDEEHHLLIAFSVASLTCADQLAFHSFVKNFFRFFSAMKIPHQLTLKLLAVISSLVFVTHGMPHEGSAIDPLALVGRDDTANYVIYPKDTTNKDQATAIYNLLKGVVSDPTTIYVADTSKGTFFWSAPLTSDNAQKVEADSNVRICSHLRSKGLLTDNPRSLQLFKNAHQIAPIQQILPTKAPPLNQGALTIMPTTKRHLDL